MKFGSPAIYAWLYRDAKTDEYKRKLMRWLEEENPDLAEMVKKELAHADRKRDSGAAKGRVQHGSGGSGEADADR